MLGPRDRATKTPTHSLTWQSFQSIDKNNNQGTLVAMEKEKKKKEWPLTRLCLPESSFQAGETRSLLAERHSGCNTLCGRLGKKRRSGKIEGQTANAVTCKALKASCSPTLGWPGNSGRSARGVELCTGSFYFFSFNFYWGIVDLQCC